MTSVACPICRGKEGLFHSKGCYLSFINDKNKEDETDEGDYNNEDDREEGEK